MSTVERFWSRVRKTPTCWIWEGALNDSGYGVFKYQGKFWYVHRLSLTWHLGRPLEKPQVDHMCKVTACVNPEHLREVEQWENCQDQNVELGRSGVRGVHWDRTNRRWQVSMRKQGVRHRRGPFKSLDDAIAAADALRESLS